MTEPEKLNSSNQQSISTEPKNSRIALHLADINIEELKQLTPASAAPPQAASGGEATNWKHLLAAGFAPIFLWARDLP